MPQRDVAELAAALLAAEREGRPPLVELRACALALAGACEVVELVPGRRLRHGELWHVIALDALDALAAAVERR